ncbi:MAG TPA: transposase, partial [Verrucomicrobiota bacterium]|nr:transposase [Verrucomicrobiota bacterium]
MINENHTAATGTVCNSEVFTFPAVKKCAVQASFTGGEVSSDGGIALLRQTDRRIGLTRALAQVLPDPRDPGRIKHPLLSLIRQRLYGLAAGYEDLNDHDTLRHDLAWQTAVERDHALASSPTLCRLENRANRQVAWAVHAVLINQFIASFPQTPAELILDFDTTDDRVHGRQA